MSILGWVLAWCESGLNNVTEDFGAEINKEFECWLLWSTRLGYQHNRPAWPGMSVSACQQCRCWIATVTVWSLAGRRCRLSYTLSLHLWSKYWLVFLLANSIAIALCPGELWSVDLRYILLWQTVSNAAEKSPATQIVWSGGFLWLNPIAMSVVICSRAEVVE